MSTSIQPAGATKVDAPTAYRYKHIVVVHGIGDHAPNETALEFMNEFIRNLPSTGRYRVKVANLIASVDESTVKRGTTPKGQARGFRPAYLTFEDYGNPPRKGTPELVHIISFSEVYWKPITSKYLATNGGPPIPIPTWAHSVSTRLLGPEYYLQLWRTAIDNLETMLGLLRKFGMLYGKSKQLASILDRFLGDVQMYAESDDLRMEIDTLFKSVMDRVEGFAKAALAQFGEATNVQAPKVDPEIYVVAHSEGTVVSLSSLVREAQSEEQPKRPSAWLSPVNETPGGWLSWVKGFVTMGSPIDKHYTIWKTKFRTDLLQRDRPNKIPWYNFWDQSDPVGYGLTAVYPNDAAPTDAKKMFEVKYDAGFSRYPIPGKAHIDYWTDQSIHRTIIRKVMELTPDATTQAVRGGWSRVLPWIDYGAYLAVRLATLGFLFVVIDKLATRLTGLTTGIGLGTQLCPCPGRPWLPVVSGQWLGIGSIVGVLSAVVTECVDWLLKSRLVTDRTARFRWSEWISVVRNGLVVSGFGAALLAAGGLVEPCYANAAFCLLLPVVAGKVLGEAAEFRGFFPFARIFRFVMTVAWAVGAVLAALAFPIRLASGSLIKDGVEYGTLLIAGILAWRLHTTIHQGLVQMWRYTVDDDATVKT